MRFRYLVLTLFPGLIASCSESDSDVCADKSVGEIPVGMEYSKSDRITDLGIEHVIHISVDGLHPAPITTLGVDELPGFYRLRKNGSFTDNARTDGDLAYTFPNHTSQFTGRFVNGEGGHNWLLPDNLGDCNYNLHENKGAYVTGVFDVAHDFGLKTAFYTSKSKFRLFEDSWDDDSGAIDMVEPDHGRAKIDSYVFEEDTDELVDVFLDDLEKSRYDYAFLHLRDPDTAGHEHTWSLEADSEYLEAVEHVDELVLRILDFVDETDGFTSSTVLILTADHGGEFGENFHLLDRDQGYVESGVIPFYVYGKSVPAGEDLYSWNPTTTFDPGNNHPLNNDSLQPIRNGDAANLIMELLGLPNVPGSTIDNLNFPFL